MYIKEKLSRLKGKWYWKPVLIAGLAFLLAVCVSVTTIGWLTSRDRTANSFTVGTVAAQVQEIFPSPYTKKSDVKVENTGDVPIYIRAVVSIYWQTENGTMLAGMPEENLDYTITWSGSLNWKKQGDIYYYTQPLPPKAVTDVLIESCEQKSNFGEEEKLMVDISVQAIQAQPATAVYDAWGITVGTDGSLIFDAQP